MKLESLFLFERTMGSLVSVTRNSFGPDRDTNSNAVQVKDVQYIPLVEQGMMQVKARTFSGPDANEYQSIISIDDVEYINEEEFNNMQGTSEVVFELISSGGTPFYVKDNRTNNDVKVRCTCEDFRWRFAKYNYNDQSLQGDPPEAYAKKTDRPSVNPHNTPGVCKHLIKLKKELERDDFFRTVLQ